MKFNIEIKINEDSKVENSQPLHETLIRQELIGHLKYCFQLESHENDTEFSEFQIDISDDGDGECNHYSIKDVK